MKNGLVLEIPPTYDEISLNSNWPSYEEISIDESFLKGAITTITLADLREKTYIKQRGKAWGCFYQSDQFQNVKPLSYFENLEKSKNAMIDSDNNSFEEKDLQNNTDDNLMILKASKSNHVLIIDNKINYL